MNIFDLPDELIVHIISWITVKSFQNLLLCCRYLSKFGRDEYVWKLIAKQQASDIFRYKPFQKDYKWLCLAKVYARCETNNMIVYGEIKDGIEEGICITIVKRGIHIYSGHFIDGKLDGYGICWNKYFKYVGIWKKGEKDSYGTAEYFDGDVYQGDWKEDVRTGKGKYIWSTGSYYNGDFSNNEIEGYGVYISGNEKYEGNWKKSMRHGIGEIIWKSGDSYKGDFSYNIKFGQGVHIWKDGGVYKGEWNENNRHGQAESTFANGVKYIGSYKNDKREGDGILYWPDGDRYQGKWINGDRNGPGILYSKGKEIKQIWTGEIHGIYSKIIPPKYPDL
uniref:F-box and MORN repeat protein n=1 Tax=Pithovirus LCPAC302 TaxID=2506593 RepID=A0A481Z824_9VIRU|nr:MAG: F-box and MORN repeat protein [Pithovirus LCPAC302]